MLFVDKSELAKTLPGAKVIDGMAMPCQAFYTALALAMEE